jgi:DNA-binding beta-propeller fold protein YncE
MRRHSGMFNMLVAAGKEAAALTLMLALVGGAASAQNQPQPTLVDVGPIANLLDADAAVLNPIPNKLYTSFSDGVHVLNLSTKTSANLGTFGVNLRPFGPLAVNPAKNRIYAVFDKGIKVIDGDTDAVAQTLAIPQLKNVFALAVNSLTNQLFVANSDGTFQQIDAENGTILASTALHRFPS